jgi:hypothetical protein
MLSFYTDSSFTIRNADYFLSLLRHRSVFKWASRPDQIQPYQHASEIICGHCLLWLRDLAFLDERLNGFLTHAQSTYATEARICRAEFMTLRSLLPDTASPVVNIDNTAAHEVP